MMKLCSVTGCLKKHRARSLCATHYNGKYLAHRHAGNVTVECAGCGRLCEKRPDPRRPRRYCSLTCRTDSQYRELRAARPGTALVHVGSVWPRCELPARHPARADRRKPRVFVSGPCAWCGEQFTIDQAAARYCSRRCLKKANKLADHFVVSPVVRLSIYERDGWTCQLCFDPVDSDLPPSDEWAASLDHIVCQSWTTEPDHSPANLRLAHRWCNAVRGDEKYYTAADLAA